MKHHIWKLLLTGIFCFINITTDAQNTLRVSVTDSANLEKLTGVVVALKGTTNAAATDTAGLASLSNIPGGPQTIELSYIGYTKRSLTLTFPLSVPQPIEIRLVSAEAEIEVVTITSTRTNSRIEDAPIKVEVLGAEELTEEVSIKPGNMSSLLGDVSGVQIQQTSATSGNSVVRMQGLNGRYTMLLRDGMPAFSGLSTGLSVLQIPPLDLRQVEIVKGPASTLNGGGAISGLINFITKEPGDSTEAAFLLNQSTLLETNLNAYVSGRKNKMGYTLFAGGTHQAAVDVNGDGFSDVAKTLSLIVHPQLFFYPDKATKVRVGFIGNYESRTGGDMQVIRGQADSTHQYFEKSILENYGVDVVLSHDMKNKQGIFMKASANYFERSFSTNYAAQSGGQWTGYSELYYQIPHGRHNFIVGGNYLMDLFRKSAGDTSFYRNYDYHTVGIFAQYSFNIESRLNLQAGVRADYQNKFGAFVLPSVAALIHASREFSIRVNGGSGYKVPNLLEILGLEEGINTPNGTLALTPEHSYGGTAEWSYRKFFDKKELSVFFNQTFFYTWVQHAIITSQDAAGNYNIYNVNQGATTMGVDNYVRIKREPVELYLGYTFTYPRKEFDKAQPYLTLTPLHRLATVLSTDIGKHFKVGVEGSLFGVQYLDDGSKSKTYFFMAASVQYRVKKITLVLNGENLLDQRQSRYGQVVFAPYTRPKFAQLWGPLDGRVINASILVRL